MLRTMRRMLLALGQRIGETIFSPWTLSLMIFDIKRTIARIKNFRKRELVPAFDKLHLGCGWRHVGGWLNVDVRHSDHDVDLGNGRLPWRRDVFAAVISQHTIEHLELTQEVIPLVKELFRVIQPGGEIWLSCPDIVKVCQSYFDQQMQDLLVDRQRRIPSYQLGPMPSNHLINDIFYAKGEHKNLFDLSLLQWVLATCGFVAVTQVEEADLLERFPEFPAREDDLQTLYVRALKPA